MNKFELKKNAVSIKSSDIKERAASVIKRDAWTSDSQDDSYYEEEYMPDYICLKAPSFNTYAKRLGFDEDAWSEEIDYEQIEESYNEKYSSANRPKCDCANCKKYRRRLRTAQKMAKKVYHDTFPSLSKAVLEGLFANQIDHPTIALKSLIGLFKKFEDQEFTLL
jgi:hypothetical protein